jgi:hypothetical protein
MSTSEPKKNEAPASEAVADPGPPEAAGQTAEAGGVKTAESTADQAEHEAEQETKPESPVQGQPAATVQQASTDEPVWPPPESQPADPADPAAGSPAVEAALASLPDDPALLTKPDEASPAAKPEQPIGKPEEPAAEPSQEMGLSESTLHWLVDGEVPIEPSEAHPILAPIYDPRAPVAGRTRTFAIIGGAAVLAMGIAWALHAQAAHHRNATAAVATTVNNSADLLLHRAEAALAQGRSAEALDLAHLATVTDSRMADAYVVMGLVQRSSGQMVEARDSYRRYLELAPLGSHAAEARAALTSLPP